MKIGRFIIAVMTSSLLTVGCASQNMAVFLATKNDTYLTQMRDNEFNYWSDQIKARRQKFENDMDTFVINSIRESEAKGVLTGAGVAYLMQKEHELRLQFDANEKASIAALDTRLTSYEGLAQLNREAIAKLTEQNIDLASKVQKLDADLTSQVQELAYSSLSRRQALYGSAPAALPVDPAVNPVVIPTVK